MLHFRENIAITYISLFIFDREAMRVGRDDANIMIEIYRHDDAVYA